MRSLRKNLSYTYADLKLGFHLIVISIENVILNVRISALVPVCVFISNEKDTSRNNSAI